MTHGTCRIVRDDDCDHQGGENVDANLHQLQWLTISTQTTVLQDDEKTRSKLPEFNAEGWTGDFGFVLACWCSSFSFMQWSCICICHWYYFFQVHEGPCKPSCEGMEDLGAFKAFNLRATNNGLIVISNMNVDDSLILITNVLIRMESHFISGLCVHDFFQCARKMRKLGAKRSQVKTKSIYPNIFNVANVMCFELKTQVSKYIKWDFNRKVFIVQVQGPSSILLTCQIVHKDWDQRECSGIILNSVKSNIIKLYQTQRPESFAIESIKKCSKVQIWRK